MNDLLTLQTNFQAYLLNCEEKISADIVDTQKVPVDIRLAIYGHAYRARLLEALATNFPMLHIYLGDEQFAEVGNAYINQHPSHFRSIRWFGDQLENFLRTDANYADFVYVAELAKIEWLMTLVFDAADGNTAKLEDLSQIPPESWVDMHLLAHPSIHLTQLSYNSIAIWQMLSQEEAPPEPEEYAAATNWAFWRNDLINHYCSLPEDEAAALQAILNGNSFGEVCEVLCQFMDEHEVAMRAASLLKGWIAAGLIAEINY